MAEPDFRALCAELADALDACLIGGGPSEDTGDLDDDLITRARAALAQPEAEKPTDKELLGCMLKAAASVPGGQCTGILDWDQEAVAAARAVLARWGLPVPQPISVSERLPGEGECCGNPRNGQGQWCWGRETPKTTAETPVVWRLMPRECLETEAVEWLPHWALPLPQGKAQ